MLVSVVYETGTVVMVVLEQGVVIAVVLETELVVSVEVEDRVEVVTTSVVVEDVHDEEVIPEEDVHEAVMVVVGVGVHVGQAVSNASAATEAARWIL